MPLDEVYARLYEWARWAAHHFPQLGIQEPPYAAQWYPRQNWDPGWGDMGPPVQVPPAIDERAAHAVDLALMRIAKDHRNRIKTVYIKTRKWWHIWDMKLSERMELDSAARALGDILHG